MTSTSRRWRMVVGLVAAAILGLAACGDDGGDDSEAGTGGSDAGDDGAQGSDGGSDGGDDDGGGGDDALVTQGDGAGADFPIAIPDGVLLDALADAGLSFESQRQLYYPSDDYDRLVAFYDEWTSANGEWARGEAAGTVTFSRIDGEGLQSITITPDQDAGAQADGPVTFVLLVAG